LQVLNEPVPFSSSSKDDDEDACERLLKEFSPSETEEIASVSYAYWMVRKNANIRLPADSQRISALKEIRRHYVGEGRNFASALAAIHGALEYRRTYRIDIIRSCFYDSDNLEHEDAELAKKYRVYILDDLEIQPMVVRGVDDQNRVIIYKHSRKTSGDGDGKGFIITQIYTAERAMATSEFSSRGKEERLSVVFNFQDYSRKNTPPTSAQMTMIRMLQRCYPERLGVLIIVSSPFWLRGLYNIIWALLSKATTEKLRLPSGQAAVDQEFHKIVSTNKELEVMLTNGEISSVDFSNYTQHPFYSPFE